MYVTDSRFPFPIIASLLCAQLDHFGSGSALLAGGDIGQGALPSQQRAARWFSCVAHALYDNGATPNNIIFRCEPSLKQQAERIAPARDERLSQVLRRALRDLRPG